jgi:hypothetical protein
MTQLVKLAPPLIPQQVRGIIEAGRSQSLYNESCDCPALMMPRACCGIKGGARFYQLCHTIPTELYYLTEMGKEDSERPWGGGGQLA